jgi:hypothetical protein
MIYLFLGLSLITNGFSIWYAYNLLKDRIALVELFKSFSPIVKNYETHLESLTKMEMYYGDPTLMGLVEHTKEVSKRLDDVIESIEVEEQPNDKEEE